MTIKHYKPTTPGRRKASVQDFSDVTSGKPVRSLVKVLKQHAGRNNSGQITVRHRGGGVKRLYRLIDFKLTKYDVSGTIKTIEYDPNRGARIALVEYADAEKAYIVLPQGLNVGDKIISSSGPV